MGSFQWKNIKTRLAIVKTVTQAMKMRALWGLLSSPLSRGTRAVPKSFPSKMTGSRSPMMLIKFSSFRVFGPVRLSRPASQAATNKRKKSPL
jgi:hypothetical protein